MQQMNPAVVAYAGFWRRLAAYLIDSVILSVVLFLGFFLYGVVVGVQSSINGSPTPNSSSLGGGIAVIYVLWFVVVLLYYSIFEASPLQGTPGKLALGIKVTDLEGGRISYGRSAGRVLAKILSGLIIFIGYLLAAFTERKQALHDLIAGTLVVTRQPGAPMQQSYAGYSAYPSYPPPAPPPPAPPPLAPSALPPSEPPPSI